jgi:hypothetical protein
MFLLLIACGPDRPTPPDFRTAPTVNQRVTAIQARSDGQVTSRLADLREAARQDPEPRVRDQVALRLTAWAREPALVALEDIWRHDTHHGVAATALAGLTALCAAVAGPLQPDQPPERPIPPPCAPVYDGSRHLPPLQPVPRQTAAAFWASEGVLTRVLRNGEVWPAAESDRLRTAKKYADPDTIRRRRSVVPPALP